METAACESSRSTSWANLQLVNKRLCFASFHFLFKKEEEEEEEAHSSSSSQLKPNERLMDFSFVEMKEKLHFLFFVISFEWTGIDGFFFLLKYTRGFNVSSFFPKSWIETASRQTRSQPVGDCYSQIIGELLKLPVMCELEHCLVPVEGSFTIQ